MLEYLLVFCPCYQIPEKQLNQLAARFKECELRLRSLGLRLEVNLIDDGSAPNYQKAIQQISDSFEFISSQSRRANLGNGYTVLEGYQWGVNKAQQYGLDVSLVGCCDGDGEHDPTSFLSAMELIKQPDVTGVLGSIDYSQSGTNTLESIADLSMMRFLAADQSAMLGLSKALAIHSPGFQLHQSRFIQAALQRLPAYQSCFGSRHPDRKSNWGMHFVVAQLTNYLGASLTVLDLPSLGAPPNRDQEKRWRQVEDALAHMRCLRLFKSEI